MSVIIEEINAELDNEQQEGGGEGETRPSEAQPQQALLDLIELSQERSNRLAVD